LSAVLGGCQSLHTNSRDEALALPTEESVKVALRTQQIIGNETGVTKTVDPLSGSHYLEYLTSEIEQGVEKYLKKIEKIGGSLEAIEKGFFQEEIRRNAYQLKKEIDNNDRIIVGVNKFQDQNDVEPILNTIDPEIEIRQVKKLKEFKKNRDQTKVSFELNKLRRLAEKHDENLMPHIISAVKGHVTLGEISDVFVDIFGKYEPKFSF
jgi:methylmalonyl-CoA mutase N-terminal domain/subunit